MVGHDGSLSGHRDADRLTDRAHPSRTVSRQGNRRRVGPVRLPDRPLQPPGADRGRGVFARRSAGAGDLRPRPLQVGQRRLWPSCRRHGAAHDRPDDAGGARRPRPRRADRRRGIRAADVARLAREHGRAPARVPRSPASDADPDRRRHLAGDGLGGNRIARERRRLRPPLRARRPRALRGQSGRPQPVPLSAVARTAGQSARDAFRAGLAIATLRSA